jgi:predicted DNA binding CopG/RHH family protein
MAADKPGVPKGTVNNPKGANQYACGKGQGQKNSRVELRLSDEDKRLLKEAAQKQGMTLAGWLLSVAKEAAAS